MCPCTQHTLKFSPPLPRSVTKDDWAEWMRHFSVELLAQSPSPALRACHGLAQVRGGKLPLRRGLTCCAKLGRGFSCL